MHLWWFFSGDSLCGISLHLLASVPPVSPVGIPLPYLTCRFLLTLNWSIFPFPFCKIFLSYVVQVSGHRPPSHCGNTLIFPVTSISYPDLPFVTYSIPISLSVPESVRPKIFLFVKVKVKSSLSVSYFLALISILLIQQY